MAGPFFVGSGRSGFPALACVAASALPGFVCRAVMTRIRTSPATPCSESAPLALLVRRQVCHTHINFSERRFRFDSMRRSLPLPMMRGVIPELFWLLAEERYQISSPLVWRKERNDDLPRTTPFAAQLIPYLHQGKGVS
jgi:hypothetical protein